MKAFFPFFQFAAAHFSRSLVSRLAFRPREIIRRGATSMLAMIFLSLAGVSAHAQIETGVAAGGATWSITDLGTLGGTQIAVTGINEAGQVVGSSTLSDDITFHAFLYSDGRMTDIGTLAGNETHAAGINDAGDIVGTSGGRPFLYTNGRLTEIQTAGATFDSVTGINNSGQIIGTSFGASGTRSFVYKNGSMTDLGTLESFQNTVAWAINNRGQIAGHAFNRNDGRAFLYQNGSMTGIGSSFSTVGFGINDAGRVVGMTRTGGADFQAFLYENDNVTTLGMLDGDQSSYAVAINNAGLVVGSSLDAIPVARAFLFVHGAMIDLSELAEVKAAGWKLQTASAINNKGQIAGTGTLHGEVRAFLLVPTLPR